MLKTNNIEAFGNHIKELFVNKHQEYVIIRAIDPDMSYDDIMKYYTQLNQYIGAMIRVDKLKYNELDQEDYWVNVQYDIPSAKTSELKPWKRDEHLKLHTDNTVSSQNANLTELVCIYPCKYSGLTTVISNTLVVELIQYIDSLHQTNTAYIPLFDQLIGREIYFSSDSINHHKRQILEYNHPYYKISFNYTQAIKSDKNTLDDIAIIERFNEFLEEKIIHSHLMDEIKLGVGDALIFNDDMIIHGRRSVIGPRYYKKCGMFLKM